MDAEYEPGSRGFLFRLERLNDLRNRLRIGLIEIRRLAQIVAVDEILERGEIFDGRLRRVERQLREALEGFTESWRVPKELEVGVHRSVKGRDQENGLDAPTARIWNEHEAGIVNDLRLIQARLQPFHQAV